MKITRYALFAALAIATLALPAMAAEPQPAPPIQITDYNSFNLAKVLQENVGKQVEVTVASGATFKGKLAGVGAQAIHLAELSGKEFYDAAIEKSAIVAVVLRARNR
jgi:hypothetical protein